MNAFQMNHLRSEDICGNVISYTVNRWPKIEVQYDN